MRIVITANGMELDAQASPVFGRCPAYVFVDTETMQFEGLENPAIGIPSGAGIQAAQFVIERGAQAIVTGNVGPNAYGVFDASGVPVYLFGSGTVRQAVEMYAAGRLELVGGANVPAYSGTGRGAGLGMGRGKWRTAASVSPTSSDRAPAAPNVPRDQEAAALRDQAQALREQLAQMEERLRQIGDEE
jgi:predicted Fe-Mo cluster-binding NifX family protein